MKKLLPLIFLTLGVMFFFLGSGFFKLEDKNWADKGTGVTSYIASVLLIIYGVVGLTNDKD